MTNEDDRGAFFVGWKVWRAIAMEIGGDRANGLDFRENCSRFLVGRWVFVVYFILFYILFKLIAIIIGRIISCFSHLL